jgi:hypothetical protein
MVMWTVRGGLPWIVGRELRVLGKETEKENKLNDYFRRRCVNYERFLCDRVWECALCAKQAGKVELVEISLPTKVETLRRR